MKRHLVISAEAIDERSLQQARDASTTAGAVLVFLGVVRDSEEGGPIQGIDYEAFLRMAEHQFNLLFDEVERRWPIEAIRLAHRVGYVRAGEPSLWLEILAPHRGEAFAAGQWLIDEMKRVVPIWKKPRVVQAPLP